MPAALDNEAAEIGLGYPSAVDQALLEGVDRLAVVLGLDVDVAAALRVGGEALAVEKGAEGDVLSVSELRRGERRALQLIDAGDVRLHDEGGAAAGRARDDADGAV